MDLISPEQCRAARALLNWSQPELAEKCGMHPQTISSFESNGGSPTARTLDTIITVFENAGIDFGINSGVSLSPNKILITYDYCNILQDVLTTLKEGDELLFHCADDRRSPPEVNDKLDSIHKKGIIMRNTICEGNTFVRSDSLYRWLPKDYFARCEVSAIYADKYVINTGGNYDETAQFVTIKNKSLAETKRRQFEYWWKNGKEVPKQ